MNSRMKSTDFSKVQTTSLRKRPCNLRVGDLAQIPDPNAPLQEFYTSLPRLGASAEMLAAAEALTQSALSEKSILWLVDEAVVEAGLSPILVRMVQTGLIRGIVMTGTAALRDYELAVHGAAHEDEKAGLRDGLLGLSRETGEGMNGIINDGVKRGFGLGECLGRGILDRQPKYYTRSIMAACAARVVPCMVVVSVGVDGFHRHPMADGAMLGKGSLKDLQILASRIPSLHRGGTLVSVSSTPSLRDVFYHAYASAKNLGEAVEDFAVIRFGDAAPSFEDVPGLRAEYHLSGPLELIVPLFTGVIFSQIE